MESLKNDDFAKLLGIYLPWVIKSLEISADSETLTIIVEKQSDKGRFSFLAASKKGQQVTRRWQHVRLGHYATYIQASMSLDELAELSETHCPAFLGLEGKKITRELDESIRIAYSRSSIPDIISGLLGIKSELIESKIREIETEESQLKTLPTLPLESEAIWREILLDKVKLSTRLLPLKLLLSRLKLDINRNPDDKAMLQRASAELRNFFNRHALQLKSEYEQVGATNNRTNQASSSGKLKLVLPSTQNKIWHELLTNSLELETNSMPMKLNLANKRQSYTAAKSDVDRLEVVRSLQIFFKNNARTHIHELRFLTELLEKQKSNLDELPDENHEIWKQLLADDQLLNSEKINYRLFLSRVKLDYSRDHDGNSAKKLHDFFSQNSKYMTEEIGKINSLAKAL
ncbi:hypothetical protein [Reinekea sp.]|jgi:hypothetical protein|uniref:hypothetical protein n=1 Tax=Reinekea sp. TaxID=1970455 RepID=UPI003989EEBE